jgi:hypothetical protein
MHGTGSCGGDNIVSVTAPQALECIDSLGGSRTRIWSVLRGNIPTPDNSCLISDWRRSQGTYGVDFRVLEVLGGSREF